MRMATFDAAKARCEGCEKPHSLFWPMGDAHHLYGKGMGAAKREDRVWVPLFKASEEPNLLKWQWRRNLLWVCRKAHDEIHRLGIRAWREWRFPRKPLDRPAVIHVISPHR